MEIRKMQQKDVEQLAELERQYFTDPWSASAFTSELRNPLSLWLVCVEGDCVLGYVGSQSVLPEADIMNVAVKAEYRRQGIAKELMSSLVAMLRERDITSISLEVRASNVSAISLYEKLGFFPIGKRPAYYRHPKEDALILRKELF